MRRPSNQRLAQDIRDLVESLESYGEGVYLVGFDWKPYLRYLGNSEETRSRILSHQLDRCFRALMYVAPATEGRSRVHVLLIGGGGFFTLNLHHDKGTAYWCPPRREVYRELDTLWPH